MKIWVLIWGLFFAGTSYAQLPALPTDKAFPPYPSVWGYDISDFPAIKNGVCGIDAYRMPDGDIWFLMDYAYKYKDPMQGAFGGYTDEKFVLLKFFKGEQIELEAKQRYELAEVLREKEISKIDQRVHFSEGSTLKVHYGHMPKRCFIPGCIRNYYIKTDVDQNQKKYSILGAAPHVKIWQDEALCEAQGAPFFYERLYLLDCLIDLGDDTFIAYTEGANLILRFDQDLNTQFKPVHPLDLHHGDLIPRNFFVIDYSVIEELKRKNQSENVPLNQTVHDELLLHFKDKYQENN